MKAPSNRDGGLRVGAVIVAGITGSGRRSKAAVSHGRMSRIGFCSASLRRTRDVHGEGICAFAKPAWLEWAFMPLPPIVRWLGFAVGCWRLAWLGWTLHNLGTNLTDTVGTRTDHTLVTRGPYRYIRHPFYGVGIPPGREHDAADDVLADDRDRRAGAGVAVRFATPIEEAETDRAVGDGYRTYAAKTPRFMAGVEAAVVAAQSR
jgi:hypothetical protein